MDLAGASEWGMISGCLNKTTYLPSLKKLVSLPPGESFWIPTGIQKENPLPYGMRLVRVDQLTVHTLLHYTQAAGERHYLAGHTPHAASSLDI